MSYFTQMAGLAYHNFVSAATGIALAIAFIRGIARRQMKTIGNFWVDMVRCCLWVLLPFCVVGALLLVSQGVVQNLKPYDTVKLVEPQQVQRVDADGKPVVDASGKPVMDTVTTQTIAQGPVASQEIIKEWGTNGGGFFNANSAHPFENPTPLTQSVRDVLHLRHLCRADLHPGPHDRIAAPWLGGLGRDGHSVSGRRDRRLLGGGAWQSAARTGSTSTPPRCSPAATWKARKSASASPTPRSSPPSPPTPVAARSTAGTIPSRRSAAWFRWSTSCSAKSSSAASAPACTAFSIYIVLAVFIAGLMVGRTPEYLGKKIEAYDVKMAMLVALVFPLVILALTGISSVQRLRHVEHLQSRPARTQPDSLCVHIDGRKQRLGLRRADGQHALVRHSASASTMLIGRFFMIIPMLAIAGNLAQKKYVPPSLGTFPVTTPLFTVLLIGVILIVGALTFFPALSLGPILEHLLMDAGKTF